MSKINCQPRKLYLCPNCHKQKGVCDEKRTTDSYIEKETNLRLVSETAILTVYDTIQHDVVAPKPPIIECLCSNSSRPSSEDQNQKPKKSNDKRHRKICFPSNKLVLSPKSDNPETARAWKNFLRYRANNLKLRRKVKTNKVISPSGTGMNKCETLLYYLERPKWYHRLSHQQITCLQLFSIAVRDDLNENASLNTSMLFKKMGLCPLPKGKVFLKALQSSNYNVIKFMDALIKLTDSKAYEEPQRGDYKWNTRLIMSCICYLEMPILLRWLYVRLPPLPTVSIHSYVPKLVEPRRNKIKKGTHPYQQPVWFDFVNWSEEKQVSSENLRLQAFNRKRVRIPEAIFNYHPNLVNSDWVNDYEMQLPPKEIVKPEPVYINKVPYVWSKKECLFTAKSIAMVDKNPVQIEEDEERVKEAIWTEINDVVIPKVEKLYENYPANKIKNLFDKFKDSELHDKLYYEDYFPEEKHQQLSVSKENIQSLLHSTLAGFVDGNLISIHFPKIEKHPDIVQLIRFLRRECLSKSRKKMLLAEMETLMKCIYTGGAIDCRIPLFQEAKNLDLKNQLHYINANKYRSLAEKEHFNFFYRCWYDRYKNTQDFWISLRPDYFATDRILQIFYDYLTSGYTSIAYWPKDKVTN